MDLVVGWPCCDYDIVYVFLAYAILLVVDDVLVVHLIADLVVNMLLVSLN